MSNIVETNDFNTQITEELFNSLNSEVKEELMGLLSSVEYIKRIIDPNIKRAYELEKDEKGKIIIDVTQPHKLEDMDYFRPSALHFEKTGKYTDYRPSRTPNSPYRNWIQEERRRCYEGYVRESDGEWITGDYYFFLNYCPMLQATKDEEAGISVMALKFPKVMDGQYYLFHYIWQARLNNKMSACLASRGKGKSATAAAMLARRIILGETTNARRFQSCVVIAAEKKYLVGSETIFIRFVKYIDHCAKSTNWPSKRIRNTENNLRWEIGFMNNDGTKDGVQNTVLGGSVGDDPDKFRGSRGSLFIIEEFGTFPKLTEVYESLLPSVKDAEDAYGLIHLIGTAGNNEESFLGAKELFCNPQGHSIYGLYNVWDKLAHGKSNIAYFYPSYMNAKGFYDNNGNSNVIGALLHYLKERMDKKYHSDDPMTYLRYCAEYPFLPEESMMKTSRSFFPITELNERIKQLENDDNAFDEVEVGELFMKSDGTVDFKHTRELPIRFFPHQDNKIRGAVEIFNRPIIDENTHKPLANRYIVSLDPVDKDSAETMSLSSTFVMDLFTDSIVAEYTGRRDLAEENYEITRMLCHYYNAVCFYENNLQGFKAYMQKKDDLQYLARTPNCLQVQGIAPKESITTASYGIRTTTPVINHANILIRDWLLQEVPAEDIDGNEIKVKNLYLVKNLALLKELTLYNDKGKDNFDRIRSLSMLLIGREEYVTRFGENLSGEQPQYNDYKEDNFVKQCLFGGNKKYRKERTYTFTPLQRSEINSILKRENNLKLYRRE